MSVLDSGAAVSALVLAQVVDTEALLNVVLYSAVVTVGTTVAFSFGIVGATRFSELRRAGRGPEAGLYGALAVAGLAVCVGVIVLGITVMVDK